MTNNAGGKVVLPKDVAEAVESIRSVSGTTIVYDLEILRKDTKRGNNLTKLITEYVDEHGPQKYFSALVNGFEIEQTPEEKLAEYYDVMIESAYGLRSTYDGGVVLGIEKTLEILGITIAGINDKEAE